MKYLVLTPFLMFLKETLVKPMMDHGISELTQLDPRIEVLY